MIWIFFGICTYQKNSLKKIFLTPRFLAISENFEHQFGPLKIKTFQIWKKYLIRYKKSTYSENFKSCAQKLWFLRANWDLFLGHPVLFFYVIWQRMNKMKVRKCCMTVRSTELWIFFLKKILVIPLNCYFQMQYKDT